MVSWRIVLNIKEEIIPTLHTVLENKKKETLPIDLVKPLLP